MSAATVRRSPRHRAREAALQMLYQWEVGRAPVDTVLDTYWCVAPALVTGSSRAFAASLVKGTIEHAPRLDELIAASSEHWRLSRMAVIDRLILRLAVYEFLHEPDAPRKAVINEALELAHTFSTDEAVAFVNGVLDAIRQRLDEPAAPSTTNG